MSQNVRVFCRFRPLNSREAGEKSAVKFAGSGTVHLPSQQKEPHVFNFDRVFHTATTQEDAYTHSAAPLVEEVMNGYNCTVFAYGQTGSGKTHTMMGELGEDMTHRGIIPRLVLAIFHAIDEADTNVVFQLKLSYVEIYNERIRDLLEPSSENLKIREAAEGVYIQGVTETHVGSYDQVLNLMEVGQAARAKAATGMNAQSSRSHSVFMFTLGQTNKTNGSVKASKLILVDLAGSEKVRKTGATGQTMVEAQNINKSLSALGNVINALTSGSAAHIPYRDSKLTRLLSDSLGGNSKTVLIITASPADSEAEETLSTCRFGQRAKSIQNHARVNEDKSAAEYKRLWEAALETIEAKEHIIRTLRECLAQHSIPEPAVTDRPRGEAEPKQEVKPETKDEDEDEEHAAESSVNLWQASSPDATPQSKSMATPSPFPDTPSQPTTEERGALTPQPDPAHDPSVDDAKVQRKLVFVPPPPPRRDKPPPPPAPTQQHPRAPSGEDTAPSSPLPRAATPADDALVLKPPDCGHEKTIEDLERQLREAKEKVKELELRHRQSGGPVKNIEVPITGGGGKKRQIKGLTAFTHEHLQQQASRHRSRSRRVPQNPAPST